MTAVTYPANALETRSPAALTRPSRPVARATAAMESRQTHSLPHRWKALTDFMGDSLAAWASAGRALPASAVRPGG